MLRSVIQYSSTRTVLQYTRATFASSACRTAAKANQGVGSDDGSVPAPRKAGRPRKSVVEGEVRRPPGRPPKPLGVEFAAEAPKKPGRPATTSKPIPVSSAERINLPDVSDWRAIFPYSKVKDRISVSNPHTAATMAEAFVPEGSLNKVVIEAFPGPGALTRALLNLPKERIHKLIVIEDYEPYLEYLRPLAEIDPRVEVVTKNGFAWDSYQFIEDAGLLGDISPHAWDEGPHPRLHFISHLPLATMGEQFVAQALRCIPEQSWLFKFGRVPMNYILSEWVWSRISAKIKDNTRCKLTIIAEATANCKMALDPRSTEIYDDHFHPVTSRSLYPFALPENRRPGTPFLAVDMKPHARQPIGMGMLDKWDYCLRRLYVMKSTPLKAAISHLAPGAAALVKTIGNSKLPESERVDVKKPIKALTVNDWAILLRAFDEWPFQPEDLMVTDAFREDDRRLG